MNDFNRIELSLVFYDKFKNNINLIMKFVRYIAANKEMIFQSIITIYSAKVCIIQNIS